MVLTPIPVFPLPVNCQQLPKGQGMAVELETGTLVAALQQALVAL